MKTRVCLGMGYRTSLNCLSPGLKYKGDNSVRLMWNITLNAVVSHKVSVSDLILYHIIPTFNDPNEEGFGKHLEKEKMLILWFPNFAVNSFPHNDTF